MNAQPSEPLSGLAITPTAIEAINGLLTDSANPVIAAVNALVVRYGGPEEINAMAREARRLDRLIAQLGDRGSPYVSDLEWLAGERDKGAFVPLADYERAVRGDALPTADRPPEVTLEISALQYFPWLIAEAKHSIQNQELMPGRYIRVRKMKEQEADGDLLAVTAAMSIIGATHVETLDTRGTDGSNIHLNGPSTITGYYGGIGQPNDYPLRWADELLHYYTQYGVRQVLNTNAGTVLVAYMLYKLGIDCAFKISVFMGSDNPYSILWTLIGARLFARPDGSTPLIGLNFSNSVSNETIELSAGIRRALDLEAQVRFEHHITETWKSIVRQPYNRRDELLDVARHVANISAKHEGSDPEIERGREHPSDVLDYFREKAEIEAKGEMPLHLTNYLDKHEAVDRTARALIARGIPVIPAGRLHGQSAD